MRPSFVLKYLLNKANFIKAGTIFFGGGMAIIMLYVFGHVGGLEWKLILVLLSFLGGMGWSFGMWLALQDDIRLLTAYWEARQRQEK